MSICLVILFFSGYLLGKVSPQQSKSPVDIGEVLTISCNDGDTRFTKQFQIVGYKRSSENESAKGWWITFRDKDGIRNLFLEPVVN